LCIVEEQSAVSRQQSVRAGSPQIYADGLIEKKQPQKLAANFANEHESKF
jgi:hypothetical protein